MSVPDARGQQVGLVGERDIKLAKDEDNRHHWITLDTIDRMGENLHLINGDEMRHRWREHQV